MAVQDNLLKFGWFINSEWLQNSKESLLEKEMTQELLNTDIKEFGSNAIELKLDRVANQLKGPVCLQIAKIRNVLTAKANEYGGGSSAKMLKLTLVDGNSSCSALDLDGTVTKLSINTPPGTKVRLKGTVVLDHGLLLINGSNCEVLGGKVEKLVEKWEINKMSFLRMQRVSEGGSGAPPWIPFGSKKTQQLYNNKATLAKDAILSKVNGAGEHGDEEETSQFDVARQEIIRKAQQTTAAKTFGSAQAKIAEALAAKNAAKATGGEKPTKPPPAHSPDNEEQRRGKFGRKGRRRGDDEDDAEVPAEYRASGPSTLFDFFQDRVPMPPAAAVPPASNRQPPPPPVANRGGFSKNYDDASKTNRNVNSRPRSELQQRPNNNRRDDNQRFPSNRGARVSNANGVAQPRWQQPPRQQQNMPQRCPFNPPPTQSVPSSHPFSRPPPPITNQQFTMPPPSLPAQPARYQNNRFETTRNALQNVALGGPPPGYASGPPPTLRAPPRPNWIDGQQCMAPWRDGLYYPAVILGDGDGTAIDVWYSEYEEAGRVTVASLLPPVQQQYADRR